ncbi:MAG: hypothetical protein QY309_07675 [Cyclobacteriaceae bacterium]|nr:MAG: hypothetical protein QY309_07675 [Cyclobacteriaceae bacterium]
MPFTKEDRIKTVFNGGNHVVILGAGASIASTIRNPEVNGKKLPSMDNFVDVVGLRDIVESLPIKEQESNFEKLYSQLHQKNHLSPEIQEIEKRVQAYFGDMRLPDAPTIYDYLILSLRSKDLIATFNWDPFLYQAFCRNRHVGDLPHLTFLHGNVAIGYSKEDKQCGPVGMRIRKTGNYMEPTRLLYPVEKKNYTDDEFINIEWERVKHWLKNKRTKLVTIFGYGAPVTDVEAVTLLNEAWGTSSDRPYEQFEIIDVRPEEQVRKQWDNFIHSHHYDYSTDYFNSLLSRNPRRTFESYHQHMFPLSEDEVFSESNPIPNDIATLEELWAWHKPLVEAENK